MRATEPVASGFATNPRDGVCLAYEVFGPPDATRTLLFLPTWILVHSRHWKLQVAYFARQGFRVVTFDGRGNGKSDRPATGYSTDDFTRDALAVMDALALERVALVGISAGGRWGIQLAAEHPERVSHLVLIGAGVRLDGGARYDLDAFLTEPTDTEGWNKHNAVYWRRDFEDWLAWFANMVGSEPHSTKASDDVVEWARGTTVEVLITSITESATPYIAEFSRSIACPTLLIHGTEDLLVPLDTSRALQALIPGSRLAVIDGAGHVPNGRDPVRTNLLIHDFLGHDTPPERHWRRAMTRPKRALYVSSPIGLGHAQRDAAIADELRRLVPGLEIDWLAQHPVTTLLEARGERIHPLSAQLAGESAHVEAALTGEHQLPVFQALREMDEILYANFTVFHDAVRETPYDLWIGDEAWDLDYYLHENPELKTAPFAWLSDFVGYLPLESDGREAELTADYNAEMLEQVARFPRVRDVSLFIGNPDDIVPDAFGPGLPSIRAWTERHFDFTGYIRYFDPAALGAPSELRERFGFGPHERVAVAAIGGTSVGASLLRRIVAAHAQLRAAVPNLRLVVVRGPRLDPASLPELPGVEYRGYVPNLYELFAAADVALVQGGLATTMELVALGKPFLYFPLQGHFEQQRHVAHRLERYGVPEWARVQYPDATPECIAARLARALSQPVAYRPVEADGARRAAARIAALVQPPACG